ncbi:MAG: hypothetical protein COU29_02100 [Candidatus Magasanikbacteria bacterium CG10_big_fil_rev_8_21_14_0_10_36_32]|uniref:DUF7670 domain-containing protein n=1 Tax=Candidatus Magasanikbacteria bacterium CG10_big_fil_rev_8_21_14_0_10_36_32 TaxID=1974646 RepID=A0A2M6W6Z7_9BACT|nr:MAG: hypothetical protein COU29_02100 [Candidatus Magasanikbacteria bacterium CG10_big_fil_rev_8_21_14_0_10_36_32]
MENKINKFIYWIPRILSILFILFLAMFSLDVFEEGLSAGQIALGLFMHNIPVLFLLAIIIISWKSEVIGGIVFILAGLFYTCMVTKEVIMSYPHQYSILTWIPTIAGPAFLVGILFLIGWMKKRKLKHPTEILPNQTK